MTTEPQWTPAPWRIGKNPHDVFGADDRGVVIDVDMDIPDDMAAANACLIAAAPELAEVARLTAEFFAGTDAPLGKRAAEVYAKALGEAP